MGCSLNATRMNKKSKQNRKYVLVLNTIIVCYSRAKDQTKPPSEKKFIFKYVRNLEVEKRKSTHLTVRRQIKGDFFLGSYGQNSSEFSDSPINGRTHT